MTKNFLTALWNKIKSNFVLKDSSGNVNLSGGTISSNTLSGTTVRANAIEGLTGGSNVPSIKVQLISGVSGGIDMNYGYISKCGSAKIISISGVSGGIDMQGGPITGLCGLSMTGTINMNSGTISGLGNVYFAKSGGISIIGGDTITGINTITMNQLTGYSGTLNINGNKINVGVTGNTNNLTLWCSGDGQGSINGLKTLNMYSGVINGVLSINGKNIEFKTQAQYNALSTKDSNTLYVITG